MSTENEVDRLLWAATEARRQRVECEQRAALLQRRLRAHPEVLAEAFVTEWTPTWAGVGSGASQ